MLTAGKQSTRLRGVKWCSRITQSPNHLQAPEYFHDDQISGCRTVHNCAGETLSWLLSSLTVLTALNFLHLLGLLLTHTVSAVCVCGGVPTLGTVFSAADASSSASLSLHSLPAHWCKQDNYSKVKINLSSAYGEPPTVTNEVRVLTML